MVSPSSGCSESRPPSEQVCRPSACTPEWFTSDWSKVNRGCREFTIEGEPLVFRAFVINTETYLQCSVTCGTGVQTRIVRCILEGVGDANCLEASRPTGQQQCSLDLCKKDFLPSPSRPPKSQYPNSVFGDFDRTAGPLTISTDLWEFQRPTTARSASTSIRTAPWS